MNTNAFAYVMDTADFDSNQLKFTGVKKERITAGNIHITCQQASESAHRFLVIDPAEDTRVFNTYEIPLKIIADYHMGQQQQILPYPKPATLVAGSDDKAAGNFIAKLKSMLEENIVSKRAYNVIMELAKEEKVVTIADFYNKYTLERLSNTEGCGAGTIDILQKLAKENHLKLREN
jgi:hypothetical protein